MTVEHVIDAHVHVWTPDFAHHPLAAGYSAANIAPVSFTPEELLAVARPLGIERIVLIQMDFYGFDNSYMLDTMRRLPGIFGGVAQVDEHGVDPAAEMRRLKAHGVRGVRIAPAKRGDPQWLDSPGMHALWRCGAEERMALCPLVDPDDLPAVARMCAAFPQTPVVIDHFGRVGRDKEIRAADLQALCDLARHPQTHVKLSAFYFLGQARPPYDDLAPMIRRLLAAFGPERLMWASDNPFQSQPPNSYAASLALIRDRLDFLTAADKRWLLERTAAKIFFS